MKILWMSDSPDSPSGFGNVTRFVCTGLAERGHRVSILGWQARGEPRTWRGCTLYPVRYNGFGADVLLHYLRRIQPDVLVALADVWWLTFIADPAIAGFMRTAGIPWALYYPIDGDLGDGRLPSGWVNVLKTVDLPIAMSRYGYEVSLRNGVTPAYIPHGVESDIFRPPPDRAAARRALGYGDAFVVLSDARNQPRKMLPRTLDIFRRFAAGKPDVVLHLHCDPDDPAARSPDYSYDLRADLAALNLTANVRITQRMSIKAGLPLEELAAIYQAADVHLLASLGEGFGLPTLQAAAAGVVPLAADYTASRELTEGHGDPIAVRAYIRDRFGVRRALIDLADAVARLDRLYYDRELLAAKSRAARAFAEGYDWTRVIPQWDALLRREAPRLRDKLRYAEATTRVTVGSAGARGPSDRVVRQALAGLPAGVQITVNVVEQQPGRLLAGILNDVVDSPDRLTLPVTLPSAAPDLARTRTTGQVLVAGAAGLDAFHALRTIFPSLAGWSSAPLDPATPDDWPEPVAPTDTGYSARLASSTLALALGEGAAVARAAARLGVPCVGLDRSPEQARLWPELTLARPDPAAAVSLGRWMLTDQGEAARICALARERAQDVGYGMPREG
jgi:glycosyltransferase involved in cell wall biosynthesis